MLNASCHAMYTEYIIWDLSQLKHHTRRNLIWRAFLINRTCIMLKLGSLAPELSIRTDCGWFSLTEQIGKKVVVFFPTR